MELRVQRILEQIKRLSIETFNENLIGVYVHGSLALGCFNWDNSDIDFIVVTKNRPEQAEKEKYISGLLDMNKNGPPKGLETSVVLQKNTRHFVYPTPFELHFSKAHLKECAENLSGYCQYMNGTDKDLAAHITIINHCCIELCGKPAKDTFGEVPEKDYWDSIICDIENAEDDITEDPVYTVLNLCRILAYKNEKLVLSKEAGGNWGIRHLDERYTGLIKNTLELYRGRTPDEPEANENELIDFARYMRGLIFAK